MTAAIQAYPLNWPAGWRRTLANQRSDAKFRKGKGGRIEGSGYKSADRVSLSEGLKRVYAELRAFGIAESSIIVSSDLRLRADGQPFAAQATSHLDQGVAVYWRDGGQQRCMAIDRYNRIADNLAAIAATLDAMRAIERHGGATILNRAFQGFAALPAPEAWWQILKLSGPDATADQIRAAHRRLISEHHPDNGGSTECAAAINRARDQGLEAL